MEQNFESIISIGIIVLMVVSMWRIFVKAGKPGWAAIIPYYNLFVLTQVSMRPVWLIIPLIPATTFSLLAIVLDPFTLIRLLGPLIFIKPVLDLVALVTYVFIAHGLAKAFGKGILDTIGFVILAPIWYPMYAFSSATYKGNLKQVTNGTISEQMSDQNQFGPQ